MEMADALRLSFDQKPASGRLGGGQPDDIWSSFSGSGTAALETVLIGGGGTSSAALGGQRRTA